jgi:hypothetical protein
MATEDYKFNKSSNIDVKEDIQYRYDFFRKQYIPERKQENPSRSKSPSSHQSRMGDDADDEDIVLDPNTNMFDRKLLKDEEIDFDLPSLQAESQKQFRRSQKASAKAQSSKSFRRLFQSLSFKFGFSSQKSNKYRSEGENDALDDDDDDGRPVFINKTIDHSSTKLKKLKFNEDDLNALHESDNLLEMYKNINKVRQPLPSTPASSSAVPSSSSIIPRPLFSDVIDDAFFGDTEDQPAVVSEVARPLRTRSRSRSPESRRSSSPNQQLPQDTPVLPPNIRRRQPTVEWYPERSPKLTVGDAISEELHYSLKVKNHKGKVVPGTFFFNPPPDTIVPSAGRFHLSVTFISTDPLRYFSIEEERYIEIEKKKPYLSWNYSGGNIIYLQPLTQSVYNCIDCELQGGTFEYSHPVGTILELGRHILNVKFYPSATDMMNYTFGYCHLNIEVSGVILPLTWEFPEPDQFNEESLIKEEKAVKHLVQNRSMASIGKIGKPLIYPDRLPEWLFCAKCVVVDPENPAKMVEIEGKYEYSPIAGMILSAGYHTLSVIFTPIQREKYHTSMTTKQIYIYKNILTLYWTKPYSLVNGEVLDQNVLNATVQPTIPGEFIYTPPLGTILPLGMHNLHVRFIPNEPCNYLSQEINNEIRIRPKKQLKISWFLPEDIIYTTPLGPEQLSASLFGNGSKSKGFFIYYPSAGTILPVGDHILSVEFFSENVIFENVTFSVKIRVLPCLSKLIWSTPNDIFEGEGIHENILNCICSNTEGEFTYSVMKGTVLKAGNNTLKCYFKPLDNHNFLENIATVNLLVRERPRFQAKLTWIHPYEKKPMSYGFALNSTVLCASCSNFPGSFTYKPSTDTILPVGQHLLTASFKPEEVHKCLPGSITSMITIMKRKPMMIWQPSSGFNAKTKLYELHYGTSLTIENYLTSYVIMSENDSQRIFGDFYYYTRKGHRFIKKLTFHPKQPLMTTTNLSENNSIVSDGGGDGGGEVDGLSRRSSLETNENQKIQQVAAVFGNKKKEKEKKEKKKIEESKEENNSEGQLPGVPPFTGLECGEHVIVCHFIPVDSQNYDEVEKEITIFVTRGYPILKWDITSHLVEEAKRRESFITRRKSSIDITTVPKYIYPFSMSHLPCRPSVSQGIKGKFQYELISEELVSEIIQEEIEVEVDDVSQELPQETGTTVTQNQDDAKGVKSIHSDVIGTNQNPILITADNQSAEVNSIDTVSSNVVNNEKRKIKKIIQKQQQVVVKQRKKLTISESIDVGKHDIQATFYPEDINNYFGSSVSITIEVTQAKPIITWEPITSVTFGTLLTTYQHGNANCTNITIPIIGGNAGEFLYDPPMGTIITISLANQYNPLNDLIEILKNQNSSSVPVHGQSAIYDEKTSSCQLPATTSFQEDETKQLIKEGQQPRDSDQNNNNDNQVHIGDILENSLVSSSSQVLQQPSHLSDMKIAQNTKNSMNKILLDSITENFNASQHNTHYLKIILSMTFLPYSLRNYEIVKMRKELIIERKAANLLWMVPYRLPYGSHLDKKILNAEISEADLNNIKSFYEINKESKEEMKKQKKQIFNKATVTDVNDKQLSLHRTSSLMKNKKNKKNKKHVRSLSKGEQATLPLASGIYLENSSFLLGEGSSIEGIPRSSSPLGREESETEKEEDEIEEEEEEEEKGYESLFSLEYDPPLNTFLNFTQREFQLRVTFRPLKNLIYFYNETIKLLYIDIYAIPPNIHWKPKFTSIQEGNPLDKRFHCNAFVEKASLFSGQLIYDPPIGSLLKPGHYNVECEYIPKHPTNELSMKLNKHFEIIKKPPKVVVYKDELTGKVIVKRIYEGVGEGGGGRHYGLKASPPSSPKGSPKRLRSASSSSPPLSPPSPSPPLLRSMLASLSRSPSPEIER